MTLDITALDLVESLQLYKLGVCMSACNDFLHGWATKPETATALMHMQEFLAKGVRENRVISPRSCEINRDLA